jgi:hypothetical protein
LIFASEGLEGVRSGERSAGLSRDTGRLMHSFASGGFFFARAGTLTRCPARTFF